MQADNFANKMTVEGGNVEKIEVRSEEEPAEKVENEDAAAQGEVHHKKAPIPISDEDAYDTDLETEDYGHRTYRSMTPKDIYLKSCEQLGVVPASYFIANMFEETMNMSHHGLGPNGTKAISAPLVINTSILDLNIEDNWITSDGMQDIADMLMENCYISVLNVAGNKLGSEGARFVCEMLQENTSLKELNVSRNDFKDTDAQYFAEALRQNFRLKELNLSGNTFCELGGEWLGQAIASNEAIEIFNLSWNHLRRKGALAVCAGMKHNITIKSLDLSWNGFADEGAMAMGEALKTNNTLTWLDLSNNRITEKGAAMLAKGLEVNDTLRTLKIGDNPLGTDGASALIRAIFKNGRSAIEELDLKGIRVNKEFLELAEQLKRRAASAAGGSRTSFSFNINPTETSTGGKGKNASQTDDPMLVMQKFLEDKRLRLVDLFRNFDKDLSWKISPAEFKKGILDAGIPFTKTQLKNLMGNLDTDIDGQVDYREFIVGRKDAILRRREMLRKEAQAKAKKKGETEKFMSVWQEAVRVATTPNASPGASPNHTPLRSRSLVVPSKLPNVPVDDNVAAQAAAKLQSYAKLSPRGSVRSGSNELTVHGSRADSRLVSSSQVSLERYSPSEEGCVQVSIEVPVVADKNPTKSTSAPSDDRKTARKKPATRKSRHTAGIPNSRKMSPNFRQVGRDR